MRLIELLIFFLLLLISSRLFKELFRAAANYKIIHKHLEVGKLQVSAHNDWPAAYTPWSDTLPLGVKVPGIQLPQKVILLQPGDPPNREPYKLFLPKVPAEALVNKQFFRTVVPRKVFELESQ